MVGVVQYSGNASFNGIYAWRGVLNAHKRLTSGSFCFGLPAAVLTNHTTTTYNQSTLHIQQIHRNNWVVPTHMVSVEDSGLRGGGSHLKSKIWNAARDTISEWTNQELTECSLYGIRVYKTGSILATHVDRLPLVSSAIINVASDLDEPWPLEVYGHDGKAYNVTMEPGDMVLYESHSVLHGVSGESRDCKRASVGLF